MDVVALQHTRLPQNLLPVLKLLEGDDHRPENIENIVWTRSRRSTATSSHLQPTTSGPVITREAQLTVISLLMFRLVLSMLCTLQIQKIYKLIHQYKVDNL